MTDAPSPPETWEWNSTASAAPETIAHLRRKPGNRECAFTVGPPGATERHSAEHLASLGLVGIYRVNPQ